VHLVDVPVDEFDRYYDVVSNQMLWFVHHGLFDLTRVPELDGGWRDAWTSYRTVNQLFAETVIAHAPHGAVVLVQDYHLTLLAPTVRAARDDLTLVHFHHTPFAGPDNARVLAAEPLIEMLAALAAHDACGFHVPEWADNYAAVQRRWGTVIDGQQAKVFAATLNSDIDSLRRVVAEEDCTSALVELDEMIGDRQMIVRVDRMELSKNIVRGFLAYDLLLEQRPDLRGRVTFVACCYPSRLGVPAYARYRDEVEATAATINDRWGSPDWTPIELMTDDDFPRSVAALRRYDVLLVNPVRDGLNLVAKEGPMVNERDGQLVLSTEAGAWTELMGAAEGISPFDLQATAEAIGSALDRDPEERVARAGLLHRAAVARTPTDWLDDQLAALT